MVHFIRSLISACRRHSLTYCSFTHAIVVKEVGDTRLAVAYHAGRRNVFGEIVSSHTWGTVMGSTVTHMANASDLPIRVCYREKKIHLDEIVEVGEEPDGFATGNGSQPASLFFKADPHVPYVRVLGNSYDKIVKRGPFYVCVLLESGNGNGCVKIAETTVPNNRSFIVTKEKSFEWQRYGANLWEDEKGTNHYPNRR